MKRLIALLLCLTCLLGVLAACNDEPPVTPPAQDNPPANNDTPAEPVDTTIYNLHLAQYTIVYPKDASEAVKKSAAYLKAKIDALLVNGDSIAMIPDSETSKTGYEILVGQTSRDASKAYYAEGTKSEFAVRNVDQTIVLAGHSDALVDLAVNYFANTYLAKAADCRIAVVENYVGGFEKSFEISAATASKIKIVYQDASLEAVATSVANKIKAVTDVTLTTALASTTYDAEAYEIMIGNYDFNEIKDVKASLWFDGYAITVRDHKIVIVGTTADEYERAVVALGDMLPAYMINGTKNVVLASGKSVRATAASLLNNVPGASVAPTAVYPAGDGAYMAYFKGVADTFFNEYVAALEAEGFTQYSRTDFNGSGRVQKNYFATYISDTNSIDVGFHARGYLGYGDSFSGGVMIVTVSPRDGLTLPRQSAPEYTEIVPTLVTQVGFDDIHPGQTSNCYIIRLADGSFIIHDSAYTQGVGDEIYKILKKQAPDPNNIVIAAWFTTHPHADHMDGLIQFANSYSADPTITVKQFVQNFADDSIATADEKSNQNKVYSAIKQFGPKVEVVKPHAGNVLYYANVKFNVLYTVEDYLAHSNGIYYGNASSMVVQMVSADGCKIIMGGDSPMMDYVLEETSGSKPYTYGALYKWYGAFIESEVVTNFHHGLGGGSSYETFAAIKPKIVLWPASWGKINGAGTQLINSSHAIYFNKKTAQSSYNSFAEGVMHDTPNYNGVYGWFVADDNIHVVTFKKDALNVTVYDTFAAFYAS